MDLLISQLDSFSLNKLEKVHKLEDLLYKSLDKNNLLMTQ